MQLSAQAENILMLAKRWRASSAESEVRNYNCLAGAIELLVRNREVALSRVAELEAALNNIKQMTSKAASLRHYADAVHEFDGVNRWHDLSEINALCGPKDTPRTSSNTAAKLAPSARDAITRTTP